MAGGIEVLSWPTSLRRHGTSYTPKKYRGWSGVKFFLKFNSIHYSPLAPDHICLLTFFACVITIFLISSCVALVISGFVIEDSKRDQPGPVVLPQQVH